jgi:hypothetical protein
MPERPSPYFEVPAPKIKLPNSQPTYGDYQPMTSTKRKTSLNKPTGGFSTLSNQSLDRSSVYVLPNQLPDKTSAYGSSNHSSDRNSKQTLSNQPQHRNSAYNLGMKKEENKIVLERPDFSQGYI